jgi:hypothetical protein
MAEDMEDESWKKNRPAATFIEPVHASGEALQWWRGAGSEGGELWGGGGSTRVALGGDARDETARGLITRHLC